MFCYVLMMETHWTRDAIIYQIYPRSFKDTTGNGIGDLMGIMKKLDHLRNGSGHSLGVDAIWLNPIYTSPQKDFGYDISDYYSIDPVYGTMEDFEALTDEAHQRGLKIIMDFVPNHTSDQHEWFKESRSSHTNPKRNWYIWKDPAPDGSPPNNWLSVFGGSAWTLDETTGQYYLHTFLECQPDLNWRNEEVRTEMRNVLHFWMHKGVDGFRTDALYHLIKDDQFRDDPPNPNYNPDYMDPYYSHIHTYSTGRPELIETTNALCETLGKHNGDSFMVSEAYLGIPQMNEMYRACDNKLHAPMNFNLIGFSWEAKVYKQFIDDFEMSLQPEDVPTYVLGNHDRARVATRLGQKRARLAAILLFTLRGMPFIYYGEELGMENHKDIPEDMRQDPWGKQVIGYDVARDPARTPMQWNDTEHAGFSTVTPWLPIHHNKDVINVARQEKDPHSMLQLYKRLMHLRKQSPALARGKYVPMESGNDQVFAFMRENGKEKMLIALNFSEQPQVIHIDIPEAEAMCNSLLDLAEKKEEVNLRNFAMRPYEGYIFHITKA